MRDPLHPILFTENDSLTLQEEPTDSEPTEEALDLFDPWNSYDELDKIQARLSVATRLSAPIPAVHSLSNGDRTTPRLPCRLPAQQWTSCNADGCYHRGKCPSYKGTQFRAETILPLPPHYSSLDTWLRLTIEQKSDAWDDYDL